MIIDKFRMYLEKEKENINLQIKLDDKMMLASLSYMYGRIAEIDKLLRIINDLPTESQLNNIIAKLSNGDLDDNYRFMGLNFKELMELKEII